MYSLRYGKVSLYCEQPIQAVRKRQAVAALAPILCQFQTLGPETGVDEILLIHS
jgi:hypothetical protein